MAGEVDKTVESSAESRIRALEEQVEQIAIRNLKVHKDKAWETSKFRVFSICALTYATIALVFWMIGVEKVLINAIIPTLGFYLSTQSLPFIKQWWLGRYFGG